VTGTDSEDDRGEFGVASDADDAVDFVGLGPDIGEAEGSVTAPRPFSPTPVFYTAPSHAHDHYSTLSAPTAHNTSRGNAMEVTFLGTSSSSPSERRNVSGVALKPSADATTWLFDCGDGTLQRVLSSPNVALHEVNKIFVSHYHSDHVLGLPQFIIAWQAVQGLRFAVPKGPVTAPRIESQHAWMPAASAAAAAAAAAVGTNAADADAETDADAAAAAAAGADAAALIRQRHLKMLANKQESRLLRVYGPCGVGAFVWESCRFSRPRTIAGVEFHEFIPSGTPLSALPPAALYFNNLPPTFCPPLPLKGSAEYNACHPRYRVRYYFADDTTDLSRCTVELTAQGPRVVSLATLGTALETRTSTSPLFTTARAAATPPLKFVFGDVKVTAVAVPHSAPSWAYAVERSPMTRLVAQRLASVAPGPHLRVLKAGRAVVAPALASVLALVAALNASGGDTTGLPDGLRALLEFLCDLAPWCAHASIVRFGSYDVSSLRMATRATPFLVPLPAAEEAYARLSAAGALARAPVPRHRKTVSGPGRPASSAEAAVRERLTAEAAAAAAVALHVPQTEAAAAAAAAATAAAAAAEAEASAAAADEEEEDDGARLCHPDLLPPGFPAALANHMVYICPLATMQTQAAQKVVLSFDTCGLRAAHPEGLAACARPDLLVHESTYLRGGAETDKAAVSRWHSTSRMAGEAAVALGAKTLVLNHFSLRYSESFLTGVYAPRRSALLRNACDALEVSAAENLNLSRLVHRTDYSIGDHVLEAAASAGILVESAPGGAPTRSPPGGFDPDAEPRPVTAARPLARVLLDAVRNTPDAVGISGSDGARGGYSSIGARRAYRFGRAPGDRSALASALAAGWPRLAAPGAGVGASAAAGAGRHAGAAAGTAGASRSGQTPSLVMAAHDLAVFRVAMSRRDEVVHTSYTSVAAPGPGQGQGQGPARQAPRARAPDAETDRVLESPAAVLPPSAAAGTSGGATTAAQLGASATDKIAELAKAAELLKVFKRAVPPAVELAPSVRGGAAALQGIWSTEAAVAAAVAVNEALGESRTFDPPAPDAAIVGPRAGESDGGQLQGPLPYLSPLRIWTEDHGDTMARLVMNNELINIESADPWAQKH
jgi:ribonuclease BN (tRNA processing enzyme)